MGDPEPFVDHATAERVRDLDKEYALHSWSVQNAIDPIPMATGEGAWLWDWDGNRYLDFASQLVNVNIGFQHLNDILWPELDISVNPEQIIRVTLQELISQIISGPLNQAFIEHEIADGLMPRLR